MILGRRGHEDVGETLVEILIAIVIIGITSTGFIAALSTGIFATDAHRRLSTGETVLRAYGELIKDKVLHPASTVSNGSVPAFAKGDIVAIPVASTVDFTDAKPYTVAFDGTLISITAQTSACTAPAVCTMTGTALGGALARTGAVVRRYEACPTAAYFADVLTGHTELTTADRLGTPTIGGITFYDKDNTSTTCATYHSTAGLSACALTTDWRTECDPPWMRVSLTLTSTDTGRSKASFSADVIIRRAA